MCKTNLFVPECQHYCSLVDGNNPNMWIPNTPINSHHTTLTKSPVPLTKPVWTHPPYRYAFLFLKHKHRFKAASQKKNVINLNYYGKDSRKMMPWENNRLVRPHVAPHRPTAESHIKLSHKIKMIIISIVII